MEDSMRRFLRSPPTRPEKGSFTWVEEKKPRQDWRMVVFCALFGLVALASALYTAHEAGRILPILHSVDVAVGGEWEPLSAAEVEALGAKIASLPKRSVSVLYTNELGATLAESFGAALRRGGYESVVVQQGIALRSGISTGRGSGLALALKAAIEETTHLKQVVSFGPEEAEREDWSFIGVGVKPK